MTAARYVIRLGLCAALLLVLVGVGAHALWQEDHDTVVWVMLIGGVLYAAAAWLAWRHEHTVTALQQRRAVGVILITALLARCLLVWAPPVSTDIYRYVWDGRVQAAGINPYRFRPADSQLAFLRDTAVYPNINRADTAVTIYPPLAQMLFLGVTRVANSITGMKAAMVGFEIATVAALLALLRSRGLPGTRIIFYAWHPLPLFEFAGSGHIDAAAIALMMLACLVAERKRPLAAGALLAGAALIKFFPAVIAPALYQRWGWRLPAALLAVIIVLYLPYLGVGWQVLGFLPGYVQDEGLADGNGFFILTALSTVFALPSWAPAAYLVAGGALLASLGWAAVMRRSAGVVSPASALLLLAVFTLVVSPHLAWYFTWIIPFLCFTPSWALMYLAAAAPLLYDYIWSPGAVALHAALYLPCAIIFALERWLGSRRPPLELSDDGSLRSRHAG
jgi:alpha-1,6-mannosyltransferase